MPDEELSSLERVRQRLYDPHQAATFAEPQLPERPVERAKGWEHLKLAQEEAEHMSGPARFFIVSVLFFFLIGGAAIGYLVWGGRAVSTNNVNVSVQGPTTTSSGDTIPLLITIENHNPVAMEATALTVEFPDGTKAPDATDTPLSIYSEDIGEIPSGGKIERTVRAAVFGSEGQHVTLPVKVEYRTASSNSTFVKNKQFDFTVTTSPVTLGVTAVSQISSGQSLTVTVDVKNNAPNPLDNVAVLATYPFGFSPSSVIPQPTSGTLFNLGTFAPGESKRITITGVVSGENNDDRVFKFSAGTLASATEPTLTTSFTEKQVDIKLTKPFLDTALSINGDTSDTPSVMGGQPVQVKLTWTNTLPTPITNAKIIVALSGDALDPSRVTVGSGFYNSSNNTIVYDASTNQGLATLQPGDTGQGTFSLTPKGGTSGLRNPAVSFKVSVSGSRLSETNVPETINSSITRTVEVGTNFALATKVLHTTGPFSNTGAWPPTVNEETTYTVVYSLTNTGNTVGGAKVVTTLPTYVRFTGATSPSDGSITYNDATRTVTWNAGDVTSGGAAELAAFQIALTPSIAQRGGSPVLVNAQQVTAVDRFTEHSISGSVSALTTQLSQDPGFSQEFGVVK